MTSDPARFPDLAVRLASGLAIGGVGLAAAWVGGSTFFALTALVAGAMIWELARMVDPEAGGLVAVLLALLAAAVLFAGRVLPPGLALPLLFVPALAGLAVLTRNRSLFLLYALLVTLAGFSVTIQREVFGFVWLAWLIAIVVATDVFGYFGGRMLGGPKLWPRLSPKKTWSGTISGWLASAAVALAFMALTGAGVELVGISVALSMASQIGDISESAIKRSMGVKDASNLIPGHGGVMDRFDGMLGASLFLLVIEQIAPFPPGLAPGAAS